MPWMDDFSAEACKLGAWKNHMDGEEPAETFEIRCVIGPISGEEHLLLTVHAEDVPDRRLRQKVAAERAERIIKALRLHDIVREVSTEATENYLEEHDYIKRSSE
jgi:hypothetical protein